MNDKKDNIIKSKSFEFALKIIEIAKTLTQENNEYILSKQILRSGTAIGALVRESEHAESKIDFIHKLAIAQKESNETQYWLELLIKSGLIQKIHENCYFLKIGKSVEFLQRL